MHISQNSFDRQMMSKAIQLAQKGLYTCSPNPRVGCVICKDGKVLAEGWHQKAGEAHAEVNALKQLTVEQSRGATVYVSLEPCAHTGKTGPCTQALIDAQVARVVCAMQDSAPHVAGKGFAVLQAAGIKTECGLLESEARALNPGFFKRMESKRPYVRVKLASSVDGRTALCNGESQWITGEAARRDVHLWRARSDAIVTGSGTVLADNPYLNARIEGLEIKQPLRVVVDSTSKLNRNLNFFKGEGVVVAGVSTQADWVLPANAQEKVHLEKLLDKLADEQINEVWVEAGATLAGAFLEAGLIDELLVYMAPVLLGDKARPLLVLNEITRMQHKKSLRLLEQRMLGDDIRFRYALN